VVDQWRKAFPEISKASAIILDLRINGGGDTGIGFQILRDLAATPFVGARQRERKYGPTERARGTWMEFIDIPADPNQPRPGGYTSRPVVVLASAATFSAAEDFLVAWKNSGRGKIIGSRAEGARANLFPLLCPEAALPACARRRIRFRMARNGWAKGSIRISSCTRFSAMFKREETPCWTGRSRS
jgi:carboxyl-terminal processing protease